MIWEGFHDEGSFGTALMTTEHHRTALGEIGAHRKRVEDPRLIQGQGQYVDDLRLPDTVEVAFVRSDHAHARILGIDLSAAREAPGVLAAWSGADVAETPRIPVRIPIEEQHISPLPPLALDYVTHVGYPVAAVVAPTRYQARDAAALIDIEYEPLPVVIDGEAALAPGAPILHPSLGTNVAFRLVKEGGDVEGGFARAANTLSFKIVHSRLAQIPLESRAILASYDRGRDFLTVWRSTQSPFITRSTLATVLGRSEDSIRVIAPDTGGAFGSKFAMYPDELTTVLLALRLGVPVRWVATRTEDFLLTVQGRDQVSEVDVAYEDDGRITALKTRTVHRVGGFLMHPVMPPLLRTTDYATGAYQIQAHRAEAVAVYTNTGPTGPYRGAGRPEGAFIAERAIETVGRALGLDPIEVRRRNFIRPDQFPYTNAIGSVYDSGNYAHTLDSALEVAEYPRLRAEQAAARQRGEIVGIGLATTIEVSAQGFDFGRVDVEPDGSIVARTGSHAHGQGHETSFAQVVADRLGVPFERVRVLHGDTAETPIGGGTGGSKSMVVGGTSMAQASEGVREKAVQVAAALLEIGADDLEYVRGGVQVRGAPGRRLDLAEIARAASEGVGLPPGERGLTADARFETTSGAVPFGAVVAQVRVDRETGKVTVERLVAVDDIGTVVNPLIVHGQVAGGLAQGIAEALYERIAWDDDGQLITASLLDYAVPTAHMLPNYELGFTETKSPFNPLGAKGVGESGCVSAPPAIVNAVLDALSPFGVTDLSMPLTPEKVWRALRASGN